MILKSSTSRARRWPASRKWLAATVVVAALLVSPASIHAQYPAPWPDVNNICEQGGSGCWIPITRFGVAMKDPIAGADSSANSNPQPKAADLFSGELGDQVTTWYAYDPSSDVVFLQKRLDGTPTLAVLGGSAPPGTDANGPFSSNTAWNFIFDFNGDGWGDIVASTDGNTGTQQNPGDTIRLGWSDTPGSQTVQIFGSGGKFDPAVDWCGNLPPDQGRILFRRKANEVPPLDGCPTQLSTDCNFSYTRVINACPTSNPVGCTTDDRNFLMEMQFPRFAFDDCLNPAGDVDGDGVGGDQKLLTDKAFLLCVTTSTQPNDYTKKDLSLDEPFDMRSTRQMVCSDPCTLTGGCSETPVIVDNVLYAACGAGANQSPVTLKVEVIDALSSPDGISVVDTIADVRFEYLQNGSATGYQLAEPVSNNPVVTPDLLPNTWSFDWDTSGLDTSDGSVYTVRAIVTDDQGNQSEAFFEIDLVDPSCSASATPVSLATFRALDLGDRTRIEWSTATEAGTVGFNLYGEVDGRRRKLNGALIPSRAVDSLSEQRYAFEIADPDADRFELEDIDILGHRRYHGMFSIDRSYGRRVSQRTIDWDALKDALRRSSVPRGSARSDGASTKSVRRPGQVVRRTPSKLPAEPSFSAADLRVEADGMYRVTYEQLAAEGFDLNGVPERNIALLTQGVPVRIRTVLPDGKATFGPGAYVEFYGEHARSQYSRTNIYRLLDDPSRAQRMYEDHRPPSENALAPSSFMATTTIDRQLQYSFGAPGDDPWYERSLLAYTSPASESFQIRARHLVPGESHAHVSVELWGMTSWPEAPDHHVVLNLNGLEMADERFDGQASHALEATILASQLYDGVNTIDVEAQGDTGVPWDLYFINSYSLTYPRGFIADADGLDFRSSGAVFEVESLMTDDVEVYRFVGQGIDHLNSVDITAESGRFRARFAGSVQEARYLVVPRENFRSPTVSAAPDPVELLDGRADYVMISHPTFVDALEPLAGFHESRGLEVAIINVEDIYDQYSHGMIDPLAIKRYIADAVDQMGVRFVLLVGGDTYDYLDHLGAGSISFIPTLYVRTGEIVSRAPADPLFGDLDGDQVPDVAIGRFPVRSEAELERVVRRTLNYDARFYRNNAVFAADANDPASPVSFVTSSEAFIQNLPDNWSFDRAYIDSSGVAGARNTLIAAINGGVALTSFVGHSGLSNWTFSGLFNSDDVDLLENHGRPTVVVQWGCWNTYHVEPSYDTLGQRLLLSEGGGAAAVLGAATLTLAASEDALGRLLMPRILSQDIPIGEAIVEAKKELALVRPDLADVIVGWTLLGDPALVVNGP